MGWNLNDSAYNCSWRVGRKLGRTLYAQCGPSPDDEDELLGLAEIDEIASLIVEAVNKFHNDGTSGGTDG